MQNIDKIIISYDFTRIIRRSHLTGIHAEIVQKLLELPIYYGTKIKVELFPENTGIFENDFYSAQNIHGKADINEWVQVFHEEPSEEFLKLSEKYFKNTLVVFFEIPPLFEKAFTRLGISYINLILHPIRFLDDMHYGFSTNNEEIRKALTKYRIQEYDIYNIVNQQKARYSWDIKATQIPKNSVLVIGQTAEDHVLIQKNKTFATLLDYRQDIEKLYDNYNHVYFKPHPLGTNSDITDFFHAQKNTTVILDNPVLETYKLLCHDSISAVVALNSSVLIEGHYFGKDCFNLIDFEYNFIEKDFTHNSKDCYILNKKAYYNPPFWHELFEKVLSKSLPKPEVIEFATLPHLRMFLRGAGSFNDSTSFTHAKKIEAVRFQCLELKEQVDNLALAMPLERQENIESENKPSITNAKSKYTKKYENVKVHVGCADVVKGGYISCDSHNYGKTDVVCEAWDLHNYFYNAQEIYSRHVVEHLSFDLLEKTLSSWYQSLKVGGRAIILFADLDELLKKLTQVQWKADEWRNRNSFTRNTMASFCNIQQTSENQDDLKCCNFHKACFNEESFTFFMRAAGFTDIEKYPSEFGFIGYKRMDNSERQINMYPENIRKDHTGRYKFVKNYIKSNQQVLDIACGIGYGSFILASEVPNISVKSIDIDSYAINYAKEFYQHENIEYIQADARKYKSDTQLDTIVSFETLEHIADVNSLLENFHSLLKDNGTFICSTPNERTFPYSPTYTPYHVRHYTPKEFTHLLEENGFSVQYMGSQHDRLSEFVSDDCDGLYLIAVCVKK